MNNSVVRINITLSLSTCIVYKSKTYQEEFSLKGKTVMLVM